MKKSKIFLSLLSIILSGLFIFSLFSFSFINKPENANVIIDGVKNKIYKFNENISQQLGNVNENKNYLPEKRVVEKVYLGGFPVGLKLFADGVVIVDTESVDTEQGLVDTAQRAGLEVGDVIKKINGEKITNNKQVSDLIEESSGQELEFEINRDGKTMTVNFKSEFSISENRYKAGIWIRDSSAGIGTVTFCTGDGYFASLGHAVCDIDTKQVIPILQGETTDVSIVECIKGKSGSAGELCGYLESEKTGDVYYNGDLGVYGKFNKMPSTQMYEIGFKDEVKTGDAEIYSTLENGRIEKYSIKITEINYNSSENKHLVIKITDEALIEKTGGIIQGMSGSPIVQNGKIVGAVTHVFLNDATGGYGIFSETMLRVINGISVNDTEESNN